MSAIDSALKLLEDDGVKSSVWHPKAKVNKALVAQVQDDARAELADLRARALPQAVVDAFGEANGAGIKMLRAIEADAKGGDK